MKRVGLLGGSFDPVHNGHIRIAKTCLRELNLDEVWFIPVLNNPFKERHMAPGKDRIAMLNLAFENNKYFKVCDIELKGDPKQKSYTYFTLLQLKKTYPKVKFFYLIGDDQVAKFDQWYEADKISEMVQLVAMDRKGYDAHLENEAKYKMIRLSYRPLEVSSSMIRSGNFKHVNKDVIQYFSMHGLYLEEIVASMMSEKRFIHTKSMAQLAMEIAQANELDTTKAYVAGMLHDIAKEMDVNEATKLMKNHFPKHLDKPVPVWHQWLSAYLAKKMFHIKDKEIIQAIKHHTTGHPCMSLLDMCIYVADKYDPSRGFDASSKIALCKKDLKVGFVDCLEDFYAFSQAKNRPIDPIFFKVYHKYKEEIHE